MKISTRFNENKKWESKGDTMTELVKLAKSTPANTAKWPKFDLSFGEAIVFKPYGKCGAGYYKVKSRLKLRSRKFIPVA